MWHKSSVRVHLIRIRCSTRVTVLSYVIAVLLLLFAYLSWNLQLKQTERKLGEKIDPMQTQTHMHTLKKNTLSHSSPSPWHSCSSSIETSAAGAVLCLFNYYRGLDGRWTPLVTSRCSAGRKLVQNYLAEGSSVSAREWRRAWVWAGVSKGAPGRHAFTTGCVVIQIQGKHLGTCACRRSLVTFLPFLRHPSQTFTTWDSSYTRTTRIFLPVMLYYWGYGQWNLKETPWQVTNVG